MRRSQTAVRKDLARRERALEMLANSRLRYSSYRGIPLAIVYLGFSHEERHRNPGRMLYFADQARSEAELADPERHLPGVVYDVRARVWTELANAYRVNESHGDADVALRQAKNYLGKGSGDLALLARAWDVEASLRREQRRIPEALDLLAEAHRLYLEMGDRHLAGRTLVSRAHVIYTSGSPADAIRVLEDAKPFLDPERDPALITNITQLLVLYLTDAGEYSRAGEILLESGLGEKLADQPLNSLRLRWVEARIHNGMGRLERAEAIFQEVRQGFLKHRLEYDAALAGLDLAAVWLRQGQQDRLLPLAAEMSQTFDRMKLQTPEAWRAVTFLSLACRHRMADLGFVERTRSFLARHQADPGLKLDPEATFRG